MGGRIRTVLCAAWVLGCSPHPAAPTQIDIPAAGAPGAASSGRTDEPEQPTPPRCRAASRAASDAAGTATLRRIDWCNHDYGVVTLSDGTAEQSGVGRPGEPAMTRYTFVDVVYGDLSGDGSEEAAVLLHQEFRDVDGSAWPGAELFAFALRDGQVVPMGSAPVSHVPDGMLRIDEGILTLFYERGAQLCSEHFALRSGRLATAGHACGE